MLDWVGGAAHAKLSQGLTRWHLAANVLPAKDDIPPAAKEGYCVVQ